MTPLALHPSSDMLDRIQIATPCDAKWEDMLGDERVRFCGACAKHVYNIGRMQREEALGLIQENEGNVCIRLYRRKDGTVLVEDCPVGLAQKAARQAKRVLIATITLFLTILAAFWGRPLPTPSVGDGASVVHGSDILDDEVLMGEMEPMEPVQIPVKRPVLMGKMKPMTSIQR